MPSPTQQFDGRAENYSSFRPSYPPEVISTITSVCGLEPGSSVADIGSGTGIFSKLLLDAGFNVSAVEPNDQMRSAAEDSLHSRPGYRSVAGTAEATTLHDHSMDVITAAQAFHWFDPEPTKVEFRRILKPNRHVALIWNHWDTDSPFLKGYRAAFRELVPEYSNVVRMRLADDDFSDFLDVGPVQFFQMPNPKLLDFDGLIGRMQSSSYAPKQDEPLYAPLVERLRNLFDAHQQNGRVSFDYLTQLYIGRLA